MYDAADTVAKKKKKSKYLFQNHHAVGSQVPTQLLTHSPQHNVGENQKGESKKKNPNESKLRQSNMW